jgi:hypothetical protein
MKSDFDKFENLVHDILIKGFTKIINCFELKIYFEK